MKNLLDLAPFLRTFEFSSKFNIGCTNTQQKKYLPVQTYFLMLSCLDFFALANDTALGFFVGGPILIAVCACDFNEHAALTMRDEWMMVKNK